MEVVLHGGPHPDSPKEVVRVLSALSDMNRYRIVELLGADGAELTCGAIGAALGLSPSLLSHHLSVLEGAGIIERRKNGLWTLNRLRREELSRKLSGLHRMLDNGSAEHGAATPADRTP
jgi:DNA-binding transcriptional ArsR family regulator